MSEINFVALAPIVRVLKIPAGKDKDAEGRGVGDDWPVADLGEDYEGDHYYVTTDRIHASELYAYNKLLDPDKAAQILANRINELYMTGQEDKWQISFEFA